MRLLFCSIRIKKLFMRHLWNGFGGVVIAAVLAGCSSDSSACRSACERPATVIQELAADTLVWWEALPSPLKEGAERVENAWRKEFVVAKGEFVEACVSSCNYGALTSEIECRRRAETVVGWTHCFKR